MATRVVLSQLQPLFVFILCLTAETVQAQSVTFADEHTIKGWHEYASFATSLQGDVTQVTEPDGQALESLSKVTFSFKQSSYGALLKNSSQRYSEDMLTITNPRYAAELQMGRDKQSTWRLVRYKADSRRRPPGEELPLPETVFCELSPHVSYRYLPLSKLLSDRSFEHTKVRRIPGQEGPSLIELSFRHTQAGKYEQIVREGTMTLVEGRITRINSIKEYETRYRGGKKDLTGVRSHVFKVREHESGFPVIESWDERYDWSMEKDQRRVAGIIHRSYALVVDSSVPDEVFDLSFYGLPEPMGIESKATSSSRTWLLLSGGALVSITVVWRYFANRRRFVNAV